MYKEDMVMHKKALKVVIRHLKKDRKVVMPTKEEKKNMIDFWVNKEGVKFKTTSGFFSAIPFEIVHRRNYGWFRTSKATLFIYYAQGAEVLYFIDIEKARKYCKENVIEKSKKGSDDGIYYKIPISTLAAEGLIKEIVYL